ncbi:type VI secretion system protein ImpH [Duganella sp. CF458]|uniref:type VI secretion system baseplate subunit TssG n=1 Tax=Duganella sp. CF458 TaxID=1884368 RepID=UPI0008F386D2|nr:type VI secretion system baseplate subunit TssG [Duganella sp. CF458]SFG80942.1 type VI secretion system protein ImpH [Duganella sp. CF458]
MQSEERWNAAGVSAAEPQGFGMFQLAGLLGAPEWRNAVSLAFPASDVAAVDGSAVTPGCIGLLGMAGALPYHYTEAVARAGGVGARAFIDLLSAPAIDAFGTAWREGRPEYTPLPFIPAQRGTLKARAVGERFAQALGVQVRIEQFAGRWEKLPPGQATALGGGNACCGTGALLGERLWRTDSAVRIHVGPLGHQLAQAFLPGGRGAQALSQLWRSGAADRGVQAEARVHFGPGVHAGAQLGAGRRLGHDALLGTQPTGERDDLCYRLC